MSAELTDSRRGLANGVGMTTRRNRVLSPAQILPPIPERIGRDKPADPIPDVCIPGDLYEPPSPAENWAPAWYVDTEKLVSTDGLWKIDKSQWKRWTGRTNSSGDVYYTGSGPLAHFNFSSTGGAAVLEAAAGADDLQFTEGPWSERTWYAPRSAFDTYRGLTAIVKRLKTINFRVTGGVLPAQGSLLTWAFSDDDTAVSSIVDKPACINKNADEQGISGRSVKTLNAVRIEKINLLSESKQLTLKTVSPWGWLPATKESKLNLYTGTNPIFYANDLARITLIGQPYHGLGVTNGATAERGLRVKGYPNREPWGYSGPVSANTRYFKAPGLSVPADPKDPRSATIYPQGFISAGDEYFNDVVFFGGRRYCASTIASGLDLADNQWLHVDDSGVIRILRATYNSRTASTTTFWIYSLGEVQYGGSLLAVKIGEVVIQTTSPEAIAEYSALNTTTKVPYQSGSDDVQMYSTSYVIASRKKRSAGYVMATKHPVAHSPNGRQIALFRGLWWRDYSIAAQKYRREVDNIHTVVTVDISSDLVVSPPTTVFQWEAKYPTDRVTTFSYAPYPQNSLYEQELATTTMTPYTERVCKLVAYDPNGQFKLVIQETRFEAESGTKVVALRSIPHENRQPMAYPNEIETDTNVKRAAFKISGFWNNNEESISGSVSKSGLSSSSFRISNNLLYFASVADNSYPDQTTEYLVSPCGHVLMTSVFPTPIGSGSSRYLSWNPRANEVGGYEVPYVANSDFVDFCSWI